jgi:hypothetical protein
MTYFSDCLRYVVRFFNLPLGISGLQKTYRRENTQKEISEDKCDEKIPGTVADNF